MTIKTIRIEIDRILSPVDNWKSFNIIFGNIQKEVQKISNQCISLYNIYNSFSEKSDADNWLHSNYGCSLRNAPYRNFVSETNLYSGNISCLTGEIYKKYFTASNSYKNLIRNGKGNPPMTFTDAFPLPITAQGTKISSQNGNCFEFSVPFLNKKSKDTFVYKQYKGNGKYEDIAIPITERKLRFQTRPGSNKGVTNALVNILAGNYSMCNSSLQCKKEGRRRKYYLLLTYKSPVIEHTELDVNRVLGIDLGVVNPAYYATNFDDRIRGSIGGRHIIFENKKQMEENRKRQIDIKYNSYDGHGRKYKLHGWDGSGHKIKNRTNTYNQKVAKDVVDTAIKYRCGTVKAEDLSGFTADHRFDTFLGKWPYFDMLSKIENKCKEHGIQFEKVNPRHTSQTCSVCGNLEPGQRISQDKFVCEKCGARLNADYNAARNIAFSNI